MKTNAISPIPSANVASTPSTRTNQPAALMPTSPSPEQMLAIDTISTTTITMAATTAIDLRLLPGCPEFTLLNGACGTVAQKIDHRRVT